MKHELKAIVNGKLIHTMNFWDHSDCVLLFDSRVVDIVSTEIYKKKYQHKVTAEYDAKGCHVSAGFVNVHIHGCVGHDTMDASVEGLLAMAKAQAADGVTSFCPTTMTASRESIASALKAVKQAMAVQAEAGLEGARILGANMEGPFISPQYKGAQKLEHIQQADFAMVEPYKDIIRLITVAPEELDNEKGRKFIQECQEAGIVVSMGHSAADYDMAAKAIEKYGIHHVTHLFNAMTGMHHRRPGMVGAALNSSQTDAELIADNIHVAPAMQNIVARLKPGRVVLITDSMRACGLGDGISELGGQQVLVKGNLATLADGTIAGSVLHMNDAVRNFAQNTTGNNVAGILPGDIAAPASINESKGELTAAGELYTGEVLAAATYNPARSINMPEYGNLAKGRPADIIIFDNNVRVQKTFCQGKLVYSAS